jgi:Tat protein secretion system quality control protein TatD with DNase activity
MVECTQPENLQDLVSTRDLVVVTVSYRSAHSLTNTVLKPFYTVYTVCMHTLYNGLKGQLHEIFDPRFFSSINPN